MTKFSQPDTRRKELSQKKILKKNESLTKKNSFGEKFFGQNFLFFRQNFIRIKLVFRQKLFGKIRNYLSTQRKFMLQVLCFTKK